MAEKRKLAPEEGPNGVDSWTSNGYGLIIDGKKVEPLQQDEDDQNIDEIEEA